MYTVTKDLHSKITAKSRRGYFAQNLDSLGSRELARKNGETSEMSIPKPIFHQVNGKQQRYNNQRSPPEVNPHHEEIVKYMSEDWNKVYREYEMNKGSGTESRGGSVVTYYQATSTSPSLQNFKAFDLDNWWGKRLFHNLTQTT